MYEKIEVELKGVQQEIQSSGAVSTMPPPSKEPELEDEPSQLFKLDNVIEYRLHRAQVEKDQDTMAPKQA